MFVDLSWKINISVTDIQKKTESRDCLKSDHEFDFSDPRISQWNWLQCQGRTVGFDAHVLCAFDPLEAQSFPLKKEDSHTPQDCY